MDEPLVSDLMTSAPVTCSVNDDVGQAARAMATHDCGALPVVASQPPHQPRGIITDRDVVLRTVAEDINPLKMKIADVMTNTALTVAQDDAVDACLAVMKRNRVRRVVVVDSTGACCGIVALADLARHLDPCRVGAVLQRVSAPSEDTSVPAP